VSRPTDFPRRLRHSQAFPCLVCGGWESLPRGRGIRCAGYSTPGSILCTREEYAGNAPLILTASPLAYRHARSGPCPCGGEHAPRLWRPYHNRVHDHLDREHLAPIFADPPLQTSLADRDEVYSFALGVLSLRNDAIADLTRRGLILSDLLEVGYRSAPAALAERRAFLRAMTERFGEDRLLKTPGFTDKNGRLAFWYGSSFVIPYRDQNGHITGLQARALADGGPKYLTARRALVSEIFHVAGYTGQGGDLVVTEGGLKAEVAARLGQVAGFGIPGQSLTASHIAAIQALAPARVIIALDQEDNPTTQQARERWAKALVQAGFTVLIAVWDGADVGGPKGLDDLFLAGGYPRLRAVSFAPPTITTRRLPYRTTTSGPVARGVSLAEARTTTTRAIHHFLRDSRRVGQNGKARAQAITSSPGTGKTSAVATVLHKHATARIVVGTAKLAEEQATAFGYELVQGRNPENCARIDVVNALAKDGHDVAKLACGSTDDRLCPHRAECPYFAQFEQPGILIGATEQLYNPLFLRPASVAVVDDGDLARAAIESHAVPLSALERAHKQLGRRANKAVKGLIPLLEHALIDAPDEALIGPAVWDHLARTAVRNAIPLAELVRALPDKPTLPSPQPDASGQVTVAAVEAVPPATLRRVLAALKEELPAFECGEDFNSRLRLRWDAERGERVIEVQRLRQGPTDKLGKNLLAEIPLLVLDATPIPALVDHLTRLHDRLPDVRVEVAVPPSVHVTQHADRTNAHSTLADPERVAEVVTAIDAERLAQPVTPDKEGAVVYRRLKADVVATGLLPSRVLTYGSARGSNALADVERLHVVGRPMPPAAELVYQAQVIHHHERPVSAQIELRPAPYGGQPYAIDVVDFVDPRVSALLHAAREDELVQVIHRARITNLVAQSQLDLDGNGDDGERRHVELVLHTSHPVPGLRVDSLQIGSFGATVNEDRERDARERIARAREELEVTGAPVSIAALARTAGASRDTVRRHLGKVDNGAGEFGKGDYTSQERSLKGPVTLPKTNSARNRTVGPPRAAPPSPLAPSGASAGSTPGLTAEVWAGATAAILASLRDPEDPTVRVPCLGGCGARVYPGQKCRPCAEAAIAAWVAAGKPRRSVPVAHVRPHARDLGEVSPEADPVANPRDGP
jgi:hypothetical protein